MKDGVPIIERWTGSIKSSGVDINYRRCRRQFPIARAIEVRYSERVQDFARGASTPYPTTIVPSFLLVLIPWLALRPWFEIRKTVSRYWSLFQLRNFCFKSTRYQQNNRYNKFLEYLNDISPIKSIREISGRYSSRYFSILR